MFTDKSKRAKDFYECSINAGCSVEDGKKSLNGFYRDYVYKNGVLIEVIEGHNLVVDNCSVLIAGLIGLKTSKMPSGIQYWAIGSGSTAWDSLWGGVTPPTPAVNDSRLVAEIFRKAVLPENIKFVDAMGNDVPDTSPTNRIKITVSIGENEANGDWREFGLFGGNATVSKDTGYMIDHKLHKILSKTSEISVTRSIILEF